MTDGPPAGAVRDPATLSARLRSAGCVWAEDEASLLLASVVEDGLDDTGLEGRIRRREAGEPLETILGWAAFRGLRIRVAPGVFVPRPRTALLVDLALERIPPHGVVADLCCGSGALGAAILSERPDVRLFASDIDPAAVETARRNLPGIPFAQVTRADVADGLSPELCGWADVIVANVPYVPSGEIRLLPGEARDFEPLHTLDGGPDGLDVLRRVADVAADGLRSGGSVLSEVEGSQADRAVDVFRAAGLDASARYSEEYETTAVIGVRR